MWQKRSWILFWLLILLKSRIAPYVRFDNMPGFLRCGHIIMARTMSSVPPDQTETVLHHWVLYDWSFEICHCRSQEPFSDSQCRLCTYHNDDLYHICHFHQAATEDMIKFARSLFCRCAIILLCMCGWQLTYLPYLYVLVHMRRDQASGCAHPA